MDKANIDSLVEEYYTSGISAKKFAEFKGIKPSTFTYWIRRKRTLERERVSENFIPLKFDTATVQASNLEMIYPNGVRIVINHFDIHQLHQLVKVF